MGSRITYGYGYECSPVLLVGASTLDLQEHRRQDG